MQDANLGYSCKLNCKTGPCSVSVYDTWTYPRLYRKKINATYSTTGHACLLPIRTKKMNCSASPPVWPSTRAWLPATTSIIQLTLGSVELSPTPPSEHLFFLSTSSFVSLRNVQDAGGRSSSGGRRRRRHGLRLQQRDNLHGRDELPHGGLRRAHFRIRHQYYRSVLL